MNPNLGSFLASADEAIARPSANGYRGPVRVGVDLGTAYTVIFVLDEQCQPIGRGL